MKLIYEMETVVKYEDGVGFIIGLRAIKEFTLKDAGCVGDSRNMMELLPGENLTKISHKWPIPVEWGQVLNRMERLKVLKGTWKVKNAHM